MFPSHPILPHLGRYVGLCERDYDMLRVQEESLGAQFEAVSCHPLYLFAAEHISFHSILQSFDHVMKRVIELACVYVRSHNICIYSLV